jgi:hypothetical protein
MRHPEVNHVIVFILHEIRIKSQEDQKFVNVIEISCVSALSRTLREQNAIYNFYPASQKTFTLRILLTR